MARRCARAMLSSRKCEMMTEKRNSMISTAPPAGRKSVSGESGNPTRLRNPSSSGCTSERISMAAVASSQVTEYSTRMCARRTLIRMVMSRMTLTTVVTFKRRSIYPPAPPPRGPRWKRRSNFSQNIGGGRFKDVSAESGPAFRIKHVGRGAAVADFDNDGDLDIVIADCGGPGLLYRNDRGNRNHRLAID